MLLARPGLLLQSSEPHCSNVWQHHPVELDHITPQLEALQYLPTWFGIKIPVLYGGLQCKAMHALVLAQSSILLCSCSVCLVQISPLPAVGNVFHIAIQYLCRHNSEAKVC